MKGAPGDNNDKRRARTNARATEFGFPDAQAAVLAWVAEELPYGIMADRLQIHAATVRNIAVRCGIHRGSRWATQHGHIRHFESKFATVPNTVATTVAAPVEATPPVESQPRPSRVPSSPRPGSVSYFTYVTKTATAAIKRLLASDRWASDDPAYACAERSLKRITDK